LFIILSSFLIQFLQINKKFAKWVLIQEGFFFVATVVATQATLLPFAVFHKVLLSKIKPSILKL